MATRKGAKAIRTGPFPFSFDDFEDWYVELTNALLRPAEMTFTRILNETLDQELSDADRNRIRVSHSRIKESTRLWNKMLGERYVDRIDSLIKIPEVVDDLVGVRVTCNNLIDVETFREIVVALQPVDPAESPSGLCIDPDSERRHSKDSGYRAYHINLHTLIPARNEWKPARGELQVRTLLQDSWGELTHENTYKPGSHMPALVTNLSKRMADLLAAVDDLAQDLRDELDTLAQQDVVAQTTVNRVTDDRGTVDGVKPENVREALLLETRRVVNGLTKPASLAQVAWRVQANFGREITTTWGGFESFKKLLKTAAPDATVIDVPPGTVVPRGIGSSMATIATSAAMPSIDGVPAVISRLKGYDSNLPAVSSDKLAALIDSVSNALRPNVWNELEIQPGAMGIREMNRLTKYIRQHAPEEAALPAKQLDYIFKCLYFSQNLRPGLDKKDIASIMGSYLFARASRLGLVSEAEDERESLEDWLTSAAP